MKKLKRKFRRLDKGCRIGLLVALFALFVGIPVYAATSAGISIVGIPQMTYDLNISSSEGGVVTTPGEGIFTYNISDVVYIKAVHNEHYRFVCWSGETDEIADVNSSATTITMIKDWDISPTFVYDPSVLSPAAEQRGQVTTTLIAIVVGAGGSLSVLGVSFKFMLAGRESEAFAITFLGVIAIIVIEAIMIAVFKAGG